MTQANTKLERRRRRLALYYNVRDVLLGLAALALVFWLVGRARGEGLDGYCYIYAQTSSAPGEFDTRFRGTGTVVADGRVLTCSHIFAGSPGPYRVKFVDGREVEARLVANDPATELALLEIPTGIGRSIRVNPADPVGKIQYGGFGQGTWRWVVGKPAPPSDAWMAFYGETACENGVCQTLPANAVLTRNGDSGGPVLNSAGELVGVSWGAVGRTVYFCGGERFKYFLDVHLPNRPAWVIRHAQPRPRPQQPSVYQQPAPPAQAPPAANPPTFTGNDPGPAPEDRPLDANGLADLDWVRNVDADLERLQNEKQDKGDFVPLDEYTNSMQSIKTDIAGEGGAVATAVKAKADELLKTVNDIVHQKIDAKLAPIDVKLTEVKQSLAVQVFGHAATFFGWQLPPAVTGAGAILGGPLGAAAAAFVWWRVSKRLKSKPQPATGGAGSQTF